MIRVWRIKENQDLLLPVKQLAHEEISKATKPLLSFGPDHLILSVGKIVKVFFGRSGAFKTTSYLVARFPLTCIAALVSEPGIFVSGSEEGILMVWDLDKGKGHKMSLVDSVATEIAEVSEWTECSLS